MKTIRHLFTVLMLLCSAVAFAHDFEVGGIYYNILSEEDKTVEVTFKGSSYSEYSNEYTGDVVIPGTVTKSEMITTVIGTFDDWTSTNKGNDGTTSQTSYTLNVKAGDILNFDWSVSSESNYDWLTITLDGTEIVKKSGTLSGSYEKTFDTAGTHTLVVKYSKDGSVDNGDDEGKVYNITLSGASGSANNTVYRVTSIGDYAFYYCSGLTSVVIPNSVTSIGERAFFGCEHLTSVVIPNSVTFIGDWAFYGCSGLTSIEIPNSVTSIGDAAFSYCSGLTSVEIPNSVTFIGDYAFYNCKGLKSITIPNSVTKIGESTFSDCSALTSIVIPNSVTFIGNEAFFYCTGLTSITSLISAEDLFSISSEVFGGVGKNACTLYVPNGAKETYASTEGWNEFTNIVELEPEVIGGSCGANVNWILENGVLTITGNGTMNDYYTWGTPAPWMEYAALITNVVIEDGVTTIGEYAFDGCGGLTSVEIPNSIIKIGESAFSNCPTLTSVVIPGSVEVFGNAVFYGCTALRKVINFSAMSLTQTYLFAGTNKTCAIYNCPNGEIVGDYIFCETDGVKTLYKHIGNGGEIVLPDNYKGENYVIGDEAFVHCSDLTGVTISNGVTSIGEFAFNGCTALTKVEIPNSVTRIGLWAFYGCDNLTEVEIPNSVTVLESGVFAYCGNLVNVVIPNSVTSIGVLTSMMEGPFEGCTSLREIKIPNSVTTIGDCAFNHCTALENIEISSSVTRIGYAAFNYCTALESVTSFIPAEELFEVNAFDGVDFDACTLYVLYGAKKIYSSTNGWNGFTNIVEMRPDEITITINQYGSATFCSDLALDFSNVEGLKAYAATGYKSNSQVVTLTRVQTAEAGVGLFLKGEPGEYVVPVIESTDEHSLNLLVGTLEQTVVNSTDGAMSNYKFTILPGDETPMFYPFEDNTTLSAGKAYLQIPTAWLPVTAQKSLSIRFDDGTTTDVDELKGESGEVKTVYDLQGRVVENPTSGIYIIDGKKVVIK